MHDPHASYREYCDAEGNHEEEPMKEVKVHLAKIVQTARAGNGEFTPIGRRDHIVVVDDKSCGPYSEIDARSVFEQYVGPAEGK